MKILFSLHHSLDENAGAPGATLELVRALRAQGHDVRLLSFDDLPRWAPPQLASLVFPWFVALRMLRRENRDIDVLDASTGDAWVWSLAMRSRRRRPLLVTRSHGLEHTAYDELRKQVAQGAVALSWRYPIYWGGLRLREVAISLRRSDHVFLLNRHDADVAVGRLGVRHERISLYRHALPQAFLDAVTYPTEAISRIRVAQIGRFTASKGAPDAVAALQKVLARYPSVDVTFFGTGCAEAEVVAAFPESVQGQVTGLRSYARSDLPTLLRDYHIKLFPSTSEGFGIALLEAMACGLAPIVAANHGALETVVHEVNGLVVPINNPRELEAALTSLVEDANPLLRLRHAAQTSATQHSWHAVALETVGAYTTAMRRT